MTYILIKKLTGKNRYALLTIVIFLSIPELIGHAMFNQKDLSVAVGVSLFTYSLIWLQKNKIIPFFIYGLTGVILSVGSRPGIWILLFTLFMGSLIFNIYARKSIKEILRYFFWVTALLTSGIVILIAIYPNLYANFLSKSFTNSSRYWAYHDTLTNGRIEKYPISLRYIPEWLITELPFGLLIISLISVLFLGMKIFQKKSTESESLINLFSLLLLIQAFSIPIYVTFFGSNLYSGLRQILFIFPAIGLLIVLYIYQISKNFNNNRSTVFLALVFYAYLALINYEQWRIAPYSYAYVSEIRTMKEVNNNWPTDFWRLSYRELVPKVSQNGLAVCNPFLLENGQHKDDFLRG